MRASWPSLLRPHPAPIGSAGSGTASTSLTVEIPSNSGRLYQYDGACYVRRGTNTVPLSVEEIGAYLNAYGASRWELTLTRNATIEDIDTEAVERYLGYRAEKSRRR